MLANFAFTLETRKQLARARLQEVPSSKVFMTKEPIDSLLIKIHMYV